MTTFHDLEVVTVVPKSGARDELLRIRPQLISEYEARYGNSFDATLSEGDDGEWIDVWRWADRADAEYALANREIIPTFDRWEELVELKSVTWTKILA